MEINIEVSEIINDDYSEFIDANSQLCIQEESFMSSAMQTLQNVQINLVKEQNNVPALINTSQSIKQQVEQSQPLVELPQPVNQPQQPPAQTWQKVSFAKKRPTPAVTSTISGIASQTTMQILSDNSQSITPNNQVKSLTSKILERTRTTIQPKTSDMQIVQPAVQDSIPKIQRVVQKIGPLPVFDCLYCCQEHFVLFKTNENILIRKYHKQLDLSMQLCLLDMALESYGKQNIVGEDQQQAETNFKMESISNNLKKLQVLTHTNNDTKYKARLKRNPKLIKKQTNTVPSQPIKQSPVKPIVQQPKYNLCDILGQSLNETNFCVNLRTRRQKILQNISFESETHNIYDPYYTSEDDEDSDSAEEEQSSQSEEEESASQNSCSESEQSEEDVQEDQLTDNSISTIERDEEDDELSSVEDERDDLPTSNQEEANPLTVHEDEEDNSERLTFGCITPQEEEEEDQKVTFSNYGEEPSLSPVRSNKNLTQERIDQLSPNQLKNALLLDHSPLSCQEIGSRRVAYNQTVTGQQCQSVIADHQMINFYPQCESETYIQQQHQQSYDTELKIGQMLSQISRPTEESKEPSTPSSTSSHCDQDDQTVTMNHLSQMTQQLNFYPQSHSFNQGSSTKYQHQKLIASNFNHLEQHMPSSKQVIKNIQKDMLKFENKDKISEMLKRTQLLKDKQMKYIANQQHFLSFDQITREQQNLTRQVDSVSAAQSLQDQGRIGQGQNTIENKTFDDIILSSRQVAVNRAAVSTLVPSGNNNSDFSQMMDIQKLKETLNKMAKTSSQQSGSKSVKVNPSSSSSKKKIAVHGHKNSMVPKLNLNPQQDDQTKQIGFSKGKLMISQRELNHLRTALCSSRYSTQAHLALNALSSYNLEEDMATNKSAKASKKSNHKKKQSKGSSNLGQKSSEKIGVKKTNHGSVKGQQSMQKTGKKGGEMMIMMQMAKQLAAKQETKTIQPEWYHPVQQQTVSNFANIQHPQQQQQHKSSLYMSIQEGKHFLPQSQHDTLNTEASSMLPNSLSKISYKKRPEKLNGSIEEVQNILNSMDFKSHGSKKGSISLSRGGGKQVSNSITRQAIDVTNNGQGQFSFSQNSVKLNLTANISKSSKGNHKKNKKSKLPPQASQGVGVAVGQQINTTTSSSTVKSGFMKQNTRQRTRSNSKQSHYVQNQQQASHQLLLTQQLSDKKHSTIKSNQKIHSETVKHKKKDNTFGPTDKVSQSHISSRKQLQITNILNPSTTANNRPSYGTSLFMLSQTTSPQKMQNHLNFSSGMMRISQNHIPLQPSMSVKESIDLKKGLAKEYYEYLSMHKKNKQ